MRSARARVVLGCAVAALGVSNLWCDSAHAAAFVLGNLVVTRSIGGGVDTGGGEGSVGSITTPSALLGSGAAASVVLDEYTTAGAFQQSIGMPNVKRTGG